MQFYSILILSKEAYKPARVFVWCGVLGLVDFGVTIEFGKYSTLSPKFKNYFLTEPEPLRSFDPLEPSEDREDAGDVELLPPTRSLHLLDDSSSESLSLSPSSILGMKFFFDKSMNL